MEILNDNTYRVDNIDHDNIDDDIDNNIDDDVNVDDN